MEEQCCYREEDDARVAIQRLVAWGLGTEEALLRASRARRRIQRLHQFLAQEFPELSEQERADCVARHLHRWNHPSSS